MAANLVEMFKIPSDWPLPCRWSRPVNISPLGNHDSLRPQEITFSSSIHIPLYFNFISCLRINLFMSFHETFRGSNFYPYDFLFFGSAISGCVHILGLTVLRKDEVQTKSCLGKGGDLFRWPQLLIEFVMKDENKIVHNSNSEHFSLLPQLSIARMDPLSQVCPGFEFILHQS